ncbi:MAG: hypothetical protein Kow00105_13950 [Phycisphaeraceae bacterium]
MTRNHARLSAALVTMFTAHASAMPVSVSSADLTGHCDPLAPLPNVVDELGTTAVFPADERIAATFTITQTDACSSSSSPLIPNVLVRITNLTNLSFTDLHYVSDPGTGFTNFDGVINGFEAVRIDNVGVNRPLVGEFGGVQPLVFEPGETWQFILDDWGNATGFGAADLGSIGVPSSIPGGDPSTGSIVAIPVPEPASIGLLTLGAVACLRRRP